MLAVGQRRWENAGSARHRGYVVAPLCQCCVNRAVIGDYSEKTENHAFLQHGGWRQGDDGKEPKRIPGQDRLDDPRVEAFRRGFHRWSGENAVSNREPDVRSLTTQERRSSLIV